MLSLKTKFEKKEKMTIQTFLARIKSVYNPLRFFALVTMTMKINFQCFWKDDPEWDTTINENITKEFQRIVKEMKN
jgi:Pao retrotransposon peptidase